MEDIEQFPNMQNVAALLEAGRRSTNLKIIKPDFPHAKPLLVLRDKDGEERVVPVDQTVDKPHHVAGTIKVTDEDSFLDYFERFAGERSLIFGALNPVQFSAVLNEHEPGEPDWRDHRLVLTLEHSDEWKEWTGHNGKSNPFNGTIEFAEWLEDQLPDITNPPNGNLMETVLAFKVTEHIVFGQHSRLSDGNIQFTYNSIVDGKTQGAAGDVRIPENFTITIPVFKGMEVPAYEIEARFRYRLLSGGVLKLWYELVRPHKVVETAFKAVWVKIEDKTNRKILLGNPG